MVDLYLKDAASARPYDALVARTLPQIQANEPNTWIQGVKILPRGRIQQKDGVALTPPAEPDRGRQAADQEVVSHGGFCELLAVAQGGGHGQARLCRSLRSTYGILRPRAAHGRLMPHDR
ncbi:hypothetical protein GCM10017687_76600 [Streptomyces echinatus]